MRKKIQPQPTVWDAMNEPVIEVTEEQAKNLMLASVLIIGAAWLAPYWNAASSVSYVSSAEGTIFEQMANVGRGGGIVAGATLTAGSEAEYSLEAPEWYYTVTDLPNVVADTVTDSAFEVLDISEPVGEMIEFYEPGVSAVWNEWLNMMRDPGTPSF